MRGDPPFYPYREIIPAKSTPHARGSTRGIMRGVGAATVYPACAGIHLSPDYSALLALGLPRMRGDPPELRAEAIRRNMSTPHARGSTRYEYSQRVFIPVYPACAGIHLR